MQVPPAPPPAVSLASVQQFATWRVAELRCEGGPPTMVRAPAPFAFLRYGAADGAAVTYAFTIDGDGRALDIRRTAPAWAANAEDLAPALAAARFAPRSRTGCSIRFAQSARPVADAPLGEVLGYAAVAGTPVGSPVRARIDAASGDCTGPYPVPVLRAYPDPKALAAMPGEVGWTVTRFDLDARGRPVNLTVAATSGRVALDRAAISAIGKSRFQVGARHGCLLPLRAGGATLPAPPAPAEETLRPAGATCPKQLPFANRPALTMPQAWQRRSIEGWAVLAYDVAPWGALGNVRVLAAQPAAEFGDWAQAVLRGATKAPGTTGYVGCVDRVRFRIGDEARLVLTAPGAQQAQAAAWRSAKPVK